MMAGHPDMFTKEQMAAMMEKALDEIEDLRSLVRVHEAVGRITSADETSSKYPS
jgi:hypothetical protein